MEYLLLSAISFINSLQMFLNFRYYGNQVSKEDFVINQSSKAMCFQRYKYKLMWEKGDIKPTSLIEFN